MYGKTKTLKTLKKLMLKVVCVCVWCACVRACVCVCVENRDDVCFNNILCVFVEILYRPELGAFRQFLHVVTEICVCLVRWCRPDVCTTGELLWCSKTCALLLLTLNSFTTHTHR